MRTHSRTPTLMAAGSWVPRFGPPDVIQFETIDVPGWWRLWPLQVGPWDAWVRAGKSALPQRPLTPGSDVCGTVVGAAVTSFAAGDIVFGVTNTQFVGGYAQYAVAADKLGVRDTEDNVSGRERRYRSTHADHGPAHIRSRGQRERLRQCALAGADPGIPRPDSSGQNLHQHFVLGRHRHVDCLELDHVRRTETMYPSCRHQRRRTRMGSHWVHAVFGKGIPQCRFMHL